MPFKSGAADAPNPLPLLTHIAQVRALSPIEAARKYPVRVEAIVTYSSSQTGSHFFQDGTAGAWADFGEKEVEFKIGQRMELSGESDPGEFAPIIRVTQSRDLGPGQLPAALTVSFDDLLTGRFDSYYIEFTGVVHETREEPGTLSLLLAVGHHTLWARVSLSADEPAPKLLNALIRVRAVCGSSFNDRRQLVHVHLLVSSLSELTVVRPGIPDPFDLPLQTVSSLLQFNPAQVAHTMARVRGTVTLSIPGELVVIQEETGGIFAETSETMPLQAGDQVELAGWPLAGDYTPRLHNAVIRRISSGTPIAPIEVGNAPFDYDTPRPEVWDGRLVRLKGILLDYSARRKEAVLLIDASGTTIQAVLHDSGRSDFKLGNHPALSSLRPGSELELTGVCAQTVDRHHILEKFNLHLRSPEDVRVLASPSRWTAANLVQVIAVLLLAVGLGGTWVCALRSQVRKVTVELAQKHALLEQSAQSFIAIFHASPIPQSISDVAGGRFLEVNEALLNKAGLARDEVIGKTVFELQFYADPASRMQIVERLKKTGAVRDLELQFRARVGEILHVFYSATLINHQGTECILAAIVDVTERKRAEVALQHRTEALEASNAKLKLFNELAVGRELQMIQLKHEINELAQQLNRPIPYPEVPVHPLAKAHSSLREQRESDEGLSSPIPQTALIPSAEFLNPSL